MTCFNIRPLFRMGHVYNRNDKKDLRVRDNVECGSL